MKKYISSIAIISLILGSQTISSAQTIEFEKLDFKTPFEEQVFRDYKSANSLDLLLAISPKMNKEKADGIKQKILSFEEELKQKKFESKKEAKKIKTLFDLTHSSFLGKYEDVVNFGDIFTTKTFNCVSGSGLYAIILDDFNIPYAIKESPTHVYIVVNPDESHIVLESTLPGMGFIDKSDHYVKSIVDQLVELKQMTQEEVDRVGYRNMYNAHFFSEDVISMLALASIQYSNEAISYLDEDDTEKALESIYKAQYLYESKSNEYILTSILGSLVSENTLKDSNEFKQIVEYSNVVNTNSEYIIALYKEKAYNKIFNEGDIEFAGQMTNYLTTNLKDTNIVQEITFNHNLQLAGYYQAKSEWLKSLEYASIAHKLNPKNVSLENLITVSINNSQMGKTTTQKTLDELLSYRKQYPFLEGNSMLMNLITRQSSFLAIDYFRKYDLKNSAKAIDIAEDMVKTYKDKVNYNEDLLSEYYTRLCEYYFQKNQYKRGSQAIKDGLEILPDNKQLQDKRSLLKRAGYY